MVRCGIAVALLVMLCAPMASAQSPPAWTRKGNWYERGRGTWSFFGVGVCPKDSLEHAVQRTTADNMARAAIAKGVRVSIQRTIDGTSEALRVTTSLTLFGAGIIDHWFSPDGTIYSLARMDVTDAQLEELVRLNTRPAAEPSPPPEVAPTPPPKRERDWGDWRKRVAWRQTVDGEDVIMAVGRCGKPQRMERDELARCVNEAHDQARSRARALADSFKPPLMLSPGSHTEAHSIPEGRREVAMLLRIEITGRRSNEPDHAAVRRRVERAHRERARAGVAAAEPLAPWVPSVRKFLARLKAVRRARAGRDLEERDGARPRIWTRRGVWEERGGTGTVYFSVGTTSLGNRSVDRAVEEAAQRAWNALSDKGVRTRDGGLLDLRVSRGQVTVLIGTRLE